MKLVVSTSRPATRRHTLDAFTLSELLVTLAVFCLALIGALYGHIYGLKFSGIIRAKLAASDQARIACGRLMQDIRSGKLIQVGNGGLSTFTQCADGTLQQGNAIQIQPYTNTAQFVRYYVDLSDRKLKRTTNGSTYTDIIAEYITNNVVFTSEDYRGTNLTSSQNNRVIGLKMQFYQIQYPLTQIGPSNYYDYYQLQTKITRRTLE